MRILALVLPMAAGDISGALVPAECENYIGHFSTDTTALFLQTFERLAHRNLRKLLSKNDCQRAMGAMALTVSFFGKRP
mgnify:CR=1 FL=1